MMPVEVANTHDVRAGSDFYRAPETESDHIVDERAEIHAIAVTFVKLAPGLVIIRYAVPLLRALMPFPWLRYQTFEDFRREIEREPQRMKRLVWISAGVWKTRIVAGLTLRSVTIVAVSFGLIAGGTYVLRSWRIRKQATKVIESEAARIAGKCCEELKDKANAKRHLRQSAEGGNQR